MDLTPGRRRIDPTVAERLRGIEDPTEDPGLWLDRFMLGDTRKNTK